MRITKIAVRRSAKINTGNYENTDVEVMLEASLDAGESASLAYASLSSSADQLVRDKVDEIELGKRKVASKAGRFGV